MRKPEFEAQRPRRLLWAQLLQRTFGLRVPALLVSPFARRGYVEHQIFDHTFVLKMIQWRWNLLPPQGRLEEDMVGRV